MESRHNKIGLAIISGVVIALLVLGIAYAMGPKEQFLRVEDYLSRDRPITIEYVIDEKDPQGKYPTRKRTFSPEQRQFTGSFEILRIPRLRTLDRETWSPEYLGYATPDAWLVTQSDGGKVTTLRIMRAGFAQIQQGSDVIRCKGGVDTRKMLEIIVED